MDRRQGELVFRTWGGKREGAGRKPKGARAGMPHAARPKLKHSTPVHVTLRVVDAVRGLRRLDTWRALRFAAARILERVDFRIVHMSIQGNHIHLLVEADDEGALSRGMRAFEISAARGINDAISRRTGRRRRGIVFPDRYHAEQLTSPRQCRHALSYVLNNWRKHREDLGRVGAAFDRFATGWHWDGWTEPPPPVRLTPETELVPVSYPTTWMLREGWRRHGLISPWERPGIRA